MPEDLPAMTPSLVGAILLLARELSPSWKMWPTVAETLAIVGASKSQAYELRDRLRRVLPTVLGKPGRPASQPPDKNDTAEILACIRDYLHDHLSAICDGQRHAYPDDFRRMIVGFTAPGRPGESMSTAELASTCAIPLGTLKDWLRPQSQDSRPAPASPEVAPPAAPSESPRAIHLQLVATLWLGWKGTFLAFGQMLRADHRLRLSDTFIGNFLQSTGLRQRQPQVPVEAPWSSNTFRTLFPGAQWLGDGTSIEIDWGDTSFIFNVEAILDSASNGLVGLHVSDSEDAESVCLAYAAAVATTGSSPLGISLDNRASNHTLGVAEAVGDAVLLRSTPYRGQAKAPLEGAFGLFQQGMPPLVITGETPRAMARSALSLIMEAWARGRNGKRRKGLRKDTPAEAYAKAHPTPEEIKAALDYIHDLKRRRDLADQTREARSDPVRLQLLKLGLVELGIPDPEGRLAVALAYFSREAIARGLAIFRTKRDLEMLPSDADPGRYLGGIIRQLNIQMELELTSQYILEQRIRLRDLTLEPLQRLATQLRDQVAVSVLPKVFVDRALEATYAVDFRFWSQAAAEAVAILPANDRQALYQPLCRRITVSFKADRQRRADLIHRLAEAVAA